MDCFKIPFYFCLMFCGIAVGFEGVYNHLTAVEEFPFQVTIEIDRKAVCSGAVVGDYWVLTANTCIPENETEVSRVRIRAGTSVLQRGGAFHTVSKMRRSSGISHFFRTEDADLGLIKVAYPFTFTSSIKWAAPDTEVLNENEDIKISGWSIHEGSSHKLLQKSTVRQIPHAECKEKYESLLNITKQLACLVPATADDNACLADVGGPVSVDGLITAVVSNNEYCWTRGLPLVVTNIGHFGWFIAYTISEPILRFGPRIG